jgi:hypothetical protein
MRLMSLVSSALLLAMSGSAFAQEDYTEFSSKEERFTITFPGTDDLGDHVDVGYGAVLPARVYSTWRASAVGTR